MVRMKMLARSYFCLDGGIEQVIKTVKTTSVMLNHLPQHHYIPGNGRLDPVLDFILTTPDPLKDTCFWLWVTPIVSGLNCT